MDSGGNLTTAIQIGDRVSFRAGMATHAFELREGDIGVFVVSYRHPGPTPWARVEFKDLTSSISPEQLEGICKLLPAAEIVD